MGRVLTEKDVEAAVKGGSVFAAGGGGLADHGRMLGYAAVSVGKPELVDIEELKPRDWVATSAAIGAPASTTAWEMQGQTLQSTSGPLYGYSLMLHDVPPHKSLQIQDEGLGRNRLLGCGIYIPHKSITPVVPVI